MRSMRIACCVFSAMFLLSPGTLVARSEVTNSKQPTDQLYVFVRFSADGDGSTLGWHGLLAIDPKTGVWKKLVERGFDAQVSPNGQVLAVNGVDDFGIWTCTSKSGEGLR